MNKFHLIGRRVPRIDGRKIVTGKEVIRRKQTVELKINARA